MDSRNEILNKIRRSLKTANLPYVESYPPDPGSPPLSETLAIAFTRAAEAVHAQVVAVPDTAAATIALVHALEARGIDRVIAWPEQALGLPELPLALSDHQIVSVPGHITGDRKEAIRAHADIEVGITSTTAGLARTGSIVLHADEQRGRLASLLPEVHFAILRVQDLYIDVAEWLRVQETQQKVHSSSNTIIITGPSRSADIGQTLTLGAHGPRELHILLLG